MSHPREAPPRHYALRRAAVFAAAAAFVLAVALPGGSFDVVVRHQVGIAIWFAVGLGIALGFLPRVRLTKTALAPIFFIGTLAVWTAIGLFWSNSAERTELEIARLAFFAGVLLLWLAFLQRDTWRVAASGLCAGAVVVCAVALASRLWPDAFPTDYVGRSFGFRLSYPLEYWNALGSWAALSAVLAIAWSAHARTPAVRAIALAGVPVAGLVMYLTFSRGSVGAGVVGVVAAICLGRNRWLALAHAVVAVALSAGVIAVVRGYPRLAEGPGGEGVGPTVLAVGGAAAACAAVALLTGRLHGDAWRLRPSLAKPAAVACGVLLTVSIVVALAGGLADRAWEEFQEPGAGTAGGGLESRFASVSGSGRIDNWEAAIEMFESEPLRGTGFGSYEHAWNQQARSPAAVQDGHSLYLETLAEGGVVGLVVLLLALAALLWAAMRTHLRLRDSARVGASAGLIAVYLAFLAHAAIDWLWESTAVAVLAVSGAAVAAVGAEATRQRGLRAPVRIGAAVVSLAAILVMLPSLVSTLSIRDSQERVRSGDIQGAAADAADAVETRPWAAAPYVQRGLVHELRGDLAAAQRELMEAERRETDNWEIALLLARVYAERGSPRAAIRAAREARRLRPRAVPFTTVEP